MSMVQSVALRRGSFTYAAPRRGSFAVRCAALPKSTDTAACANDVLQRRHVLAAMLALSACAVRPSAALAAETSSALAASSRNAPEPVYFGSGCFWGRQKDFVDAELELGRKPESLSAVAGYAGGTRAGPGDKVCYYYANPKNVYEKLGHAEVVQVDLSSDPAAAVREFKRYSEVYFSQFRRTPQGMQRLDPQDAGPGYRNVVGFPGGVNSPLYPIFQAANVNKMELREGRGNDDVRSAKEGDLLNTVWVVDSTALPFYRAEQYHQFHNEMGQSFPRAYTQGLKQAAAASGRIAPTGCPEFMF